MKIFEKYYKEVIDNAVEHWKKEKNDAFEGLENDPVVRLLLSALAYQSYNIRKDIEDYQEKTIEKLRDRLIPYHLIKPVPSFSILETRIKKEYPENSFVAKESCLFEFGKNKFKFLPLLKTKILKATIIAKTITSENSISLMLESETNIGDVSGLSFYFDCDESIDIQIEYNGKILPLIKPHQYNELPFIKWFNEDLLLNDNHYLFGSYDYWQDIFVSNNVQLFYIDKYDTKEIEFGDDKNIELNIIFNSGEAGFDVEMCDVKINCIPVINIEKKEITLSDREPIQPLSSQSGEFLNLLYNNSGQEIEKYKNSFVIRDYGVERYNQMQLFEQLKDMFNRYVSDYYAFKSVSGLKNSDKLEKIRSTLEEIYHVVNENNNIPTSGHYAIFKLNENLTKNNDRIYLEYLCTAGESANGIKLQEKAVLAPKQLDKSHTILLKETSGGKNLITNEEQKNIIAKYYFLTKDRLVTESDIRIFCHKELGSDIKRIDFKNDTSEIRINILLNKDSQLKNKYEMQRMANILQKKIELHSSNFIPKIVDLCKEKE